MHSPPFVAYSLVISRQVTQIIGLGLTASHEPSVIVKQVNPSAQEVKSRLEFPKIIIIII